MAKQTRNIDEISTNTNPAQNSAYFSYMEENCISTQKMDSQIRLTNLIPLPLVLEFSASCSE